MTLDELKTKYKAQTDHLKYLEEELERWKADRSITAKDILALQGTTPFEYEGKEVTVANMKGTYFLRAPFKPGQKKAPTTPETKASEEDKATA